MGHQRGDAMIEDQQLAQIFRAESEERLAKLDGGFMRLEKNPADHFLIEELFRETHSLKGGARMLGLMRIEGIAHDLESLLNRALQSDSPLDARAMDALDRGFKKLRREVESVLAASDRQPPPADPEPGERQSLQPAAGPREEQHSSGARPFQIETVRVETDKLDELLTLTGELGVFRARTLHRQALIARMEDKWTAMEANWRRLLATLPEADGVLARTVQAQMDAMGEFGALLHAVSGDIQENVARFDSALTRLQEQVQTARLLPLSVVFNLFPRMLRDLAKEQGKEIELSIEGADIGLDKRILEEIKDPLMHLLRNAADHGIEPPGERLRQGKPRVGHIAIAAVRAGPSVILTISDDGRGLDPEAIARTAVQRGLVDGQDAETLTHEQVHRLVFSPGFSTAFQVTELSGRGFGLDAVAAGVEHLKGTVGLSSRPGEGTTVTLRLPLSVSALRILVVRCAGHAFGLALESIRKLKNLSPSMFYRLEGRTTAAFDGEPVAVPSLAQLLELEPGGPDAEAEVIPCVVIEEEGNLLGLQIDEVIAEEEVVPRPLGTPLKRVRNVASLAALASGEICPILDTADLFRSAARLAAAVGSGTAAPAASELREKTAILLVEDSALVRAMEKRILEDAGYEVVAAVDGLDALAKLNSGSFAGVVTDIQMPNLDGLALTARLRQEPRFSGLPVILVSALASDEDKRRGLQLGANAYIPKPSFDQRLLIETLNRLVGP